MLAQIRTVAKSRVATVLMGVLAIAFVFWGIRTNFGGVGGVGGGGVIQAGGRSVSANRFRQTFQDEVKALGQQTGQEITPQDAVKNGLDRQIADAVASDEAFAAYLARMGVRPSDKLVVEQIRKAPRFFNPVSGVFDRKAYEEFVRQELGMTDAEFEGILRDELAQSQYIAAVAAATRAPMIYAALGAAFQDEGRSFAYFTLPQNAVPPPQKPSDAQLNAFLKENADRLMQPERRVLTLIRFSAAQLAPSMTPSQADVQKRFDFEKDTLSAPEKRSLVQIPAKDAVTAAQIAARLKAGGDPAEVAKSVGVQPIVYTDAPKSAIADQKVADAAFAMSPGVSGPIQGDLGLAVLKLSKVTPGRTVTLEQARPKIEAEVRQSMAETKVDQEVRAFEDARSTSSDIAAAASKAGGTVTTLPPMTAQGQSLQKPPLQPPPKVLQTAFTLPAGGDSDIIDLGQGEFVAVKVDKVLPPSVPSLDDIRPQLTQFWMARDLMTRLQGKAAALADQVRKGEPIEKAAASAGAMLGNGVAVQRGSAGQTFSEQLLGQLFAAKPGDVVVGPDVKGGALVVAKLAARVPASGAAAAQAAANLRPEMTRALLQEIGQASRAFTRAAIKPKIDYKRVTAAVGGEQDSAQ